jgi:predicted P-loop ATPase
MFADGDKSHISLDNLILVTQAEELLINRQNLITSDPELSRSGMLVAKMQDTAFKRKKDLKKKTGGKMKEKGVTEKIKNYLESTVWDGIPRVETLFIDYLGAPNTGYSKMLAQWLVFDAITKIYSPEDIMGFIIVIVGKQGIGKSLLLKKLGGEWFNNGTIVLDNILGYAKRTQNSWLIEVSELTQIQNKATFKNIMRYAQEQQCMFVGTTNSLQIFQNAASQSLMDLWKVDTDASKRTKTPWDDLTEAEVSQIWAEALHRYRNDKLICGKRSRAN